MRCLFATAFALLFAASGSIAAAELADGMTAYWRLDELTVTTVEDYTGTYDATNYGVTVAQPGLVGAAQAYDFPGDQLTKTVVQSSGFVVGGYSQFTVSAWINPDTVSTTAVGHGGAGSGDANAICEGSSGLDAFAFQIGETDEIYGFFRDQDSIAYQVTSTTSPITAGQWQHVAMRYDGATMGLYVNGQLVASTPVTGTVLANNGSWAIGGSHQSASYNMFDGRIDDFTVLSSAATPTQLSAIHGLGKFSGVGMDNTAAIDGAIEAYQAGSGSFSTAGGQIWQHVDGLSGAIGTTSGTVAGADAMIVLDSSGGGVQMADVADVMPTGLKLWLRADNMVDGDELGDGAEITNWYDNSGHGNHATVYLGSGPTRQTVVYNGKTVPVAYFDSDVDELLIAPDIINGADATDEASEAENFRDLTIIGVYQSPSTDGNERPLGFGSYRPDAKASNFNLASDPSIRKDNGFIGGYSEELGTELVIRTAIMTADGDGLVVEYFNGQDVLSAVGADFAVRSDSFFLGDIRQGTGLDDAYITEVFVFDHMLADQDRIAIEQYLGRKYGISIVPEPSAWMLLVTAMAAFGFLRRGSTKQHNR